MNNNLVELIKNKNLIVGKIKYIEDFALFERISLEDALKMNEKDLAFATPSMGRGIFKFGENGQIINIKGVDSHLDNSENVLKTITQAKAQYVITDGSKSPVLDPIGIPATGVNPILVSTDSPFCIAHTLAP